MKRSTFNFLIYFLFLLLFIGSFASMARNAYGTDLIGLSCIGFGLVFLSDSLIVLFEDRSKINPLRSLENILFASLSWLFALRVFYIRFEGVELIVSAIGFVLAIIYGLRRTSIKPKGKLSYLTTGYYLAIILFFLTLGFAPLAPFFSEILGMIGFGSLMIVILYSFLGPKVNEDEDVDSDSQVTSFKYLASLGRNGVVVSIAFIFISGYVGFTDIGILPELYTNAKPQKYIELVKNAETGREAPENGVYNYELYEEEMNEFLKKHGN